MLAVPEVRRNPAAECAAPVSDDERVPSRSTRVRGAGTANKVSRATPDLLARDGRPACSRPVACKAIQFVKENAPDFLEKLTVRNANRTCHRFWQAGPGYDGNLNELEAIYNAIEYIHNNPVRRGLVDCATDWLWSSARDRAGLGHPHILIDRTLPPLHPDGQ